MEKYLGARQEALLLYDDSLTARRLILTVTDTAQIKEIWARFHPECPDTAILGITQCDWNADLSPWPAPRAFAKGEDFTGQADAFLCGIREKLLPQARAILGDCELAVAGYSLAGLFALYAAGVDPRFTRVACMSGSLWYPGFLPWLEAHYPAQIQRAWFSLGDRETNPRHPLFCRTESCTREACALFRAHGAEAEFRLHPGNHFREVTERIMTGLLWLCR